MLNTALSYLNFSRFHNIDIIEPLLKGNADLLYANRDGVLIFVRNSNVHIMAASDEDACSKMLSLVNEAFLFVVHQSFCIKPVADKYKFGSVHECYQAVYDITSPLPLSDTCEIRTLDASYAEIILNNYDLIGSPEYIYERLESKAMLGAFVGDNFAGFIGIHAEGDIGMLHVFPEFRRMGIAKNLESSLINRMLISGEIPYCQLFIDNIASLTLQQKLGLTVADESLFWLSNIN